MTETDFTQRNEGKTWKGLRLHGEKFHSLVFIDCRFRHCDFSDCHWLECRFVNCSFEDCNLSLCFLTGTSFSGTQFSRCQLQAVVWSETVRDESLLATPNHYDGCILNHGLFIGCDLSNSRLTNCSAREADFQNADLTHADCRGTDFNGSRFLNTNLTETDLRGASNYIIPAQQNYLKKTRVALPEALSLLYSLDIVIEDSDASP